MSNILQHRMPAEIITANFAVAAPSTAVYSGYIDLATITLKAGRWLVWGAIQFNSNPGSATFGSNLGFETAIQSAPGNDSSQFLSGVNYFQDYELSLYPATNFMHGDVPPFEVVSDGTNLTFAGFTQLASQDMNLKCTVQGRTAGNVLLSGVITAKRI